MAKDDPTFLSYSRRDSEFALRLATDLRNHRLPVWVDQLDIPPGTMWDREVERALSASARVIIVLSASSVESDNVLDEIAVALDEGKELLPVLLEQCRVPLRLRRKQHIDFTGSYAEGLQRLREGLLQPSAPPQASAPFEAEPVRERLRTASMAVIPLRCLTQNEQTSLIAAGVHDEVTNSLSRITAFHVVSAATTRTLTADATSLRQVAREFGVRYAITGSVAVAAGRLRARIELSEIAAAKVLWDERFDVEVTDVFQVIDDITTAIVSRLHPHVFSAEIRRLGRKSADEMSAWELVHRARMVRWTRRA
ncbi:MAG: TIR domain-containing protein [Gammaproteobacteria bacterium]|nr:TIR domain-containing protein [Gammaproteobacteria bacterium]